MTFLTSITSSAIIVQPIVALAVLTLDFQFNLFGSFMYKPWRLFTFICASISGVTAIALLFLPESPKYMLMLGKDKESLEILKTIYNTNTRKPKEVPTANTISLLTI